MLDNDYLLKGQMYQYNLGWLIEQLLSFKQDLATAIDLKTIKYADPIQWDITTQYPANTVVVDPKSGTAYMSKVPVPAGVELTNTNYWVVVFNYQDIYNKIMDGVAFNDRDMDYATKDLLVNDLVWYAGDLYRVTRAIPAGSKYIPGTNLIKTSIESLLARYDGRDRTAQVSNDTVNVSGDYTLVAGDIAETSTNRTIKVTKDREVDVDGSDSVHVDGASTLNVGGLRTEVYAGDKTENVNGALTGSYNNVDKTFTGKNVEHYGDHSVDRALVTPGYLNAVSYGATEAADDIAPIINQLLATKNDVIYLPPGEYNVKTPIKITKFLTHFICDGTLIASGDCIDMEASSCRVYINRMIGSKTGTAFYMHSHNVTTGNSSITIDYIDRFDIGIKLHFDNNHGIQNNIFNLIRIDHFKVAIQISGGAGWCNENKFYNCWCFGYEGNAGTEIGVQFLKGAAQTDPYNGNRFVNFSCEGCATMFDLHFASRNTFENFRLIEQAGTKQILVDTDCSDNHFTSDNGYLDWQCINDKASNNVYDILFYRNSYALCRQMISQAGHLLVSAYSNLYRDFNFTFHSSGTVPEPCTLKYLTVINSSTDDMTVIIPLSTNYPNTSNGFTIETGALNGTTKIIAYGGQVIFTSADASGLSNYQLKPYHKYVVVTTFVLQYKVYEI